MIEHALRMNSDDDAKFAFTSFKKGSVAEEEQLETRGEIRGDRGTKGSTEPNTDMDGSLSTICLLTVLERTKKFVCEKYFCVLCIYIYICFLFLRFSCMLSMKLSRGNCVNGKQL